MTDQGVGDTADSSLRFDIEMESVGSSKPAIRGPLRFYSGIFVVVDYETNERTVIGSFGVYTLNLGRCDESPYEVLDEESADLELIGTTLFRTSTRKMRELVLWWDRYVFVDNVTLDEEYRGKGYGPYLLAQGLSTFFDTYDVAVLHAAPPGGYRQLSSAERSAAQKKIARAWKKAGFKKLQGEVYAASIEDVCHHADKMEEPVIRSR